MITSGALVLCIIAMYLMTTQQRVVPYLIKVDELGAAQAIRRADIPEPPNAAMFKSHLARWIEDTRSIYTDAGAEKVAMKFSFASTLEGSTAQQQLLDYMSKNNPYKLAENKSVTVNVASVQPISDKTWRVEWTEKTFSRTGSPIDDEQMQATITVSVVPPTDEATILNNPLGIYIQSFTWSSRIQ